MVNFPTPRPISRPKPYFFVQNGVVTKTFAPKFRSEPSNREVHSPYGDFFRDHFCVYVSGPLLGKFRTTFRQHYFSWNGTERNGFLFWTERNGTQHPNVNPDPKNGIVTKTFTPKFWSEPSDREVHSSYRDYFRDHFCI